MKFSMIAAFLPVVIGAAVPNVEPRATRVCACVDSAGAVTERGVTLCYIGAGAMTGDRYCGWTNNAPIENVFTEKNCAFYGAFKPHCKDI